MKNVLSAAIQNTADAGIDMELSDEYFHPYLDHLVGDHVVITEIVTTYLNYLLKGSKQNSLIKLTPKTSKRQQFKKDGIMQI